MVSWTKNGEALDKKRVNIRSTDRDSILFIRSSEREDSGAYEMCVKVEDFEDKAVLILQIVGEQTLDQIKNRKHYSLQAKTHGAMLNGYILYRTTRASCQCEDCGYLGF